MIRGISSSARSERCPGNPAKLSKAAMSELPRDTCEPSSDLCPHYRQYMLRLRSLARTSSLALRQAYQSTAQLRFPEMATAKITKWVDENQSHLIDRLAKAVEIPS